MDLYFKREHVEITKSSDGTHLPPEDTGRALSFALKLRKRKSGTSHTHSPKKVATSAKPGACLSTPRRLPARIPLCAAACASRLRSEKYKNHAMWLMMERKQDAMKAGL